MFLAYLGVEILVLSVAFILVHNFLKTFRLRRKYTAPMVFPLVLFTAGFSLRLSGVQEMMDIGFFFTDFTFVFIYILFTASFMMGQIRYWKKQ